MTPLELMLRAAKMAAQDTRSEKAGVGGEGMGICVPAIALTRFSGLCARAPVTEIHRSPMASLKIHEFSVTCH